MIIFHDTGLVCPCNSAVKRLRIAGVTAPDLLMQAQTWSMMIFPKREIRFPRRILVQGAFTVPEMYQFLRKSVCLAKKLSFCSFDTLLESARLNSMAQSA
jgi:hypothetical protein